MNKQEFWQLFLKALNEAAVNAEHRFGIPINRSFEIELHGAGYKGACITPKEALDALFIDNEHFYRIIDVAVIEIHATKTHVFVRVSAHKPGAFAETWNQPPGIGPFKQILAENVRVFDGLEMASKVSNNLSGYGERLITSSQNDISPRPNFYDLSFLEAQRRQVVAIAQDILSSKKGIIEGARLLVSLHPTVT